MRCMRNNNLKIRIVGSSCRPQLRNISASEHEYAGCHIPGYLVLISTVALFFRAYARKFYARK